MVVAHDGGRGDGTAAVDDAALAEQAASSTLTEDMVTINGTRRIEPPRATT